MGEDLAIGLAAVSAAAAATAAIASWRAIQLSRKPRLDLSFLIKDKEPLTVTVTNVGLGPARRIYLFLVFAGETFVSSGPEFSANLASDRDFTVRPKFSRTVPLTDGESPLKGFVGCYDVFGIPHVWDLEDHHMRLRRFEFHRLRWVPKRMSEHELLDKLYGDGLGERSKAMRRVGRWPDTPT